MCRKCIVSFVSKCINWNGMGYPSFAPGVDGGGQFFKLLIFATRIYWPPHGNSNGNVS